MTAYILNDYPNLKNNAAIDLSKAMMKHNRMALVKAIWPYALIYICGNLYATYIITIIKVGGGFENILPQLLILFACIPFILWAHVCLYNTIAVFYEQAKLEYENPFSHEAELREKIARQNELNVQLDLENQVIDEEAKEAEETERKSFYHAEEVSEQEDIVAEPERSWSR